MLIPHTQSPTCEMSIGTPIDFLRSTSDVVSVRCIVSNSGLDRTVLLTLLRSVCRVEADIEIPVGGSAELHALRLGFGDVAHAQDDDVPVPAPDPNVAAMAEAVAVSRPWFAITSCPFVKVLKA